MPSPSNDNFGDLPLNDENRADLEDNTGPELDSAPIQGLVPAPLKDILEQLGHEDLPDWFEDEEEFSLSQLSQAYAKVLRGEPAEAVFADLPNPPPAEESELNKSGSSPDFHNQPSHGQQQAAVDREAQDNANCPITPESIVEAILYVGLPGDEKLTLKKIAALLRDVSPKDIKAIVKQLNLRYEREQAAYRIKLAEGAVSMELDESMRPFRQAHSRTDRSVTLNAATIEVLAIVAYNQPISREKIDDTRKRSSSAILSQLIRRGLIAAEETPHKRKGQVQQYVTTEKFLDLFQLSELADLPQGQDVADLDELIQ